MQQQQFVGLTMPVFTAFGWAGEETALNYALAQLEEFIARLHASLPRDVQTRLPFFGLDRNSQSVYLAANKEPATGGGYIAFHARPLSLEMQMVFNDKMLLATAWKAGDSDPARWLKLLRDLDTGWSMRIQQMQIDEETGAAAFYQDLFKDELTRLDVEGAQQLASRAAFLNSEPKWVVPIIYSRRVTSDQAAMMGVRIINVLTEWVQSLMPLYDFHTRKDRRPTTKARPKSPRAVTAPVSTPLAVMEALPTIEGFSYTAELKSLHIRRGFVNLTASHWPFFAPNARATTRPVLVIYDDHQDKDCAVWHLADNDLARVVLSPAVHDWLEDNFNADDKIQITASKLADEIIEIRLDPVA